MKGGEGMDEMTTAELNKYLEALANLIEVTATSATEAAEIVRAYKITA